MEEFKISLFEEEYQHDFPTYRVFTELECNDVVAAIAKKYELDTMNIESELFLKQSFYEDKNASENFNLLETLQNLGINTLPNININWYQFEKIDAMDCKDLSKFFYDIWYPVADDIDLFDESLNWILSIRHDGHIYYIKSEI